MFSSTSKGIAAAAMQRHSRVLITGHRGMVGRCFAQTLNHRGFENVEMASRAECDLTNALQVAQLFERTRPEYVFHFAAKVGGIEANRTHPADFLYENLAMQNNVIRQCHIAKVSKLLFLGSSC